MKIRNYTALLTILWYDLFGENHIPLQRNGMAAIPKMFLTEQSRTR